MATNRSVSAITPLLRQSIYRGQLLRSTRYALRSRQPAIALLLHYRPVSTETSQGTGNNFPPPGFNSEQAKKPLPPQDKQKEQAREAEEEGAEISEALASQAKKRAANSQKPDPDDSRSLSEMAAEKASTDKSAEQSSSTTSETQVTEKKKDEKKLTMWGKIKKEASHYWDGTKLLATEVKISSRLALKMAAGYELTRREHRQLTRTVQDLGRLVPFSVFVIVPFAELLLPVALRLFPNLLPSTYEGQKTKDKKAATLRQSRKEVSNFLRQTLKETGLPISAANAQRDEFTEFFRKVRTTGEAPTANDVIKVCKIFKDDLTLDNLSRPQLVAITRYMNLNTFGTDAMLRYQIRHRMRQIKRDDKAIAYEGVDALSVLELQNAAASRGLRTYGASPARLREDLQMWLDLRLRYGVPSTLLVLSNAFVYAQGKETELSSQIDALQAVLASVPQELFHEIELEVHNAEGAATNKQRLEVLKEQQDLIAEENEQSESDEDAAQSSPKDDEDIDESEEGQAQAQARADSGGEQKGEEKKG